MTPLLATSQTTDDVIASDVDWAAGLLTVTIERSLESIGARGPGAVSLTQRSIRRDAPDILLPVISDVGYDSTGTIGARVTSDEELIVALDRAARRAIAVDSSASPDLTRARVTFVIDLYRDLAVEFVAHDRPVGVAPELGWVPHGEYTGILIYAADDLPLFGTNATVALEPTLFPGIYYLDQDESLIYRLTEADHVDPVRLTTDGPVAYTDDVQATGLADRLGAHPLRVLAIAAFGTRPTDVVISREDARRITASAANRALLRDGRIVVVVDPGRL